MQIWARVTKLGRRLRGYFPMKLAVGMTQWDRFVQFVLTTYDFPNYQSYHRVIAEMTMAIGKEQTHMRPIRLANAIKAAQSRQVAWEVLDRQRQDEKKRQEAVLAAIGKAEDKELAPHLADPKPVVAGSRIVENADAGKSDVVAAAQ